MKTLITIFAFALMVFAFNTNPVMAGALGNFWSSNESVDKLKDPGEAEVAFYEPDCQWKWKKDPNTGNNAWICEYFNEGEVPGDNVAWDTEPGGNVYCWQSIGINGTVTVCAPDDVWNSENDESEVAGRDDPRYDEDDHEPQRTASGYWDYCDLPNNNCNEEENDARELAGYMDYCNQTGNCMMFEDSDGDGNLEVAGKYHDSNSLDLSRDRRDYNDYIKGFASNSGCKVRFDGSVQCPGDAWNSENYESAIASINNAYCQDNPDDYLCNDDWWNEDAESKNGFGGRDVADSGNEGSTSAASADDQ